MMGVKRIEEIMREEAKSFSSPITASGVQLLVISVAIRYAEERCIEQANSISTNEKKLNIIEKHIIFDTRTEKVLYGVDGLTLVFTHNLSAIEVAKQICRDNYKVIKIKINE